MALGALSAREPVEAQPCAEEKGAWSTEADAMSGVVAAVVVDEAVDEEELGGSRGEDASTPRHR